MKLRERLKTPPKTRSKTGASTLTNPIQADSRSCDLFALPRTVWELVSLSPVRTTYPYFLSQEPSSVRLFIVHPYTVQQENLPLTPQNGCHLDPSPTLFHSMSPKFHVWHAPTSPVSFHSPLRDHTDPFKVWIKPTSLCINPSLVPWGKATTLTGTTTSYRRAGSHHFSTLVCLFYLLMVRTSQARSCPRLFFSDTSLQFPLPLFVVLQVSFRDWSSETSLSLIIRYTPSPRSVSLHILQQLIHAFVCLFVCFHPFSRI